MAAADDFNGDGMPDILWRNHATGQTLVWFMNHLTLTSTAFIAPSVDPTWEIAATLDADADGMTDIVWHSTAMGTNVVWFMNGVNQKGSTVLPTTNTAWRALGTSIRPAVADMNGDTNPDMLWRNTTSGQNLIWFLNGAGLVTTSALPSVTDQNW